MTFPKGSVITFAGMTVYDYKKLFKARGDGVRGGNQNREVVVVLFFGCLAGDSVLYCE